MRFQYGMNIEHLTNYRYLALGLMRIILVVIFMGAGYGKFPMVAGEGLAEFLPLLIAWLVVLFEFFGGLLLFLGIKYEDLTRIGAAMIAVIMVGAAYYHYCVWGDPFFSKNVMYVLSLLAMSIFFMTNGNES